MFNSRDLTTVLSELRQQAEAEAGVRCDQIETTLAHVLADVASAFYLGPSQQIGVLGLDVFQALGEPAPVSLNDEKHAELRAAVAQTFAKSRNIEIFGSNGGAP